MKDFCSLELLKYHIRSVYCCTVGLLVLPITVCIRIVAVCELHPCQVTQKLERATTREFTTKPAIIFIHCCTLGFYNSNIHSNGVVNKTVTIIQRMNAIIATALEFCISSFFNSLRIVKIDKISKTIIVKIINHLMKF